MNSVNINILDTINQQIKKISKGDEQCYQLQAKSEKTVSAKLGQLDRVLLETKTKVQQRPGTESEAVQVYQPQAIIGLGTPLPAELDNLYGKFHELQAKAAKESGVSAQATANPLPVYEADLTLIAMIMRILQDIVPRMLLILGELNKSYNELTENDFLLQMENSKLSYQYSLQANHDLKAAASQNFAAEFTGAMVDMTTGVGSVVNLSKNHQYDIHEYNDKHDAFSKLETTSAELNKLLSDPQKEQDHVDALHKLLTADQQTKIEEQVAVLRAKLEPEATKNTALLQEIEQRSLHGTDREANLRHNLKQIQVIKNSNADALTKKVNLAAPKSKLNKQKLQLTKLSPGEITNPQQVIENHQTKFKKLFPHTPCPTLEELCDSPIKGYENGYVALLPNNKVNQKDLGLYYLTKNPDEKVKQPILSKISDVQLSDNDELYSQFKNGNIYDRELLKGFKQGLNGFDPKLAKLRDEGCWEEIKGVQYMSETDGYADLFKGGQINIFTADKVFEPLPGFEQNGRIKVYQLDKQGKLYANSVLIIPQNNRAEFTTDYAAAQDHLEGNPVKLLQHSPMLTAYLNKRSNPNVPRGVFANELRAKLPELVATASLARAELDINKEYIGNVKKYLTSIKTQIKIMNKKKEHRTNLTESYFRMSAGAVKLATSSISLDAKYSEANARLLDSFGQMMEHMLALVNKSSDTYADELARFLNELRSTIMQQIALSNQLITRYYSNH